MIHHHILQWVMGVLLCIPLFDGSSDSGQKFNFCLIRPLYMIPVVVLRMQGKRQVLHFVCCSLEASFNNLLFLTSQLFLIGPNLTLILFFKALVLLNGVGTCLFILFLHFTTHAKLWFHRCFTGAPSYLSLVHENGTWSSLKMKGSIKVLSQFLKQLKNGLVSI